MHIPPEPIPNQSQNNMETKELFELLLKSNPTTVFYKGGESRNCWQSSGSIYFQIGGSFYDRFSLDEKEQIYKYLENIIRVEKEIDGDKYPIWTVDDGIIEDLNHFVRIRGKYYTVNQQERIFEQIEEVKSNLSSII